MFNWKHRKDRRRAQQGSQEGPSQQKTLHQENTVAEDTCRTGLGPNIFKSLSEGRRGGFEATTSKEKCKN